MLSCRHHGRFLCSVAPTRQRAVEQPTQAGDGHLWLGAVRDVLLRKRLLVHPGAQVPGIDPVHPQAWVLGGQHVSELLEGRLRGPVAAPPLVALDGGIAGDVHHPSAGRLEQRQGQLHQRQRVRTR